MSFRLTHEIAGLLGFRCESKHYINNPDTKWDDTDYNYSLLFAYTVHNENTDNPTLYISFMPNDHHNESRYIYILKKNGNNKWYVDETTFRDAAKYERAHAHDVTYYARFNELYTLIHQNNMLAHDYE